MRVTSLARRYAKALFEVALERDMVDQVAGELETAGELVRELPHIVELLSSPATTLKKKEEIIGDLVSGYSFSEYTSNFLKVLADNGRFDLIFEIIKGFHEAEDERKGIVEVEITTPRALGEKERSGVL